MIKKAGYPAEAHIALTKDGYLLTLHRIPGNNNSLPVLLQHGLLCSSADWIIPGKDKGLGTMSMFSMFFRSSSSREQDNETFSMKLKALVHFRDARVISVSKALARKNIEIAAKYREKF